MNLNADSFSDRVSDNWAGFPGQDVLDASFWKRLVAFKLRDRPVPLTQRGFDVFAMPGSPHG